MKTKKDIYDGQLDPRCDLSESLAFLVIPRKNFPDVRTSEEASSLVLPPKPRALEGRTCSSATILYIPNAESLQSLSLSLTTTAVSPRPGFRFLVVSLLAVVVLVLHEKVLVCAVAGKQDRRRAETREGAAKTVPAGKVTLKSPSIAIRQTTLLAVHPFRGGRLVGQAGIPRVW